MIRFFKFACLWVAACSLAFLAPAQNLQHRRKAFRSSTPSATYLINQNFEGTGYDNSETWTTSTGSPNADYTTTALLGSQSLLANTATTAARARADFTNNDNLWGYFLFRRVGGSNPAGDRLLLEIAQNGGSTRAFAISVTSTGALKVDAGTTATTTDVTAVDTTYHIWWRYAKGSGSNAIGEVAFSTNGTEPTSGNAFKNVTNGTYTGQGGRIYLGYTSTNANSDFVYDKVLVDDADIGSNP